MDDLFMTFADTAYQTDTEVRHSDASQYASAKSALTIVNEFYDKKIFPRAAEPDMTEYFDVTGTMITDGLKSPDFDDTASLYTIVYNFMLMATNIKKQANEKLPIVFRETEPDADLAIAAIDDQYHVVWKHDKLLQLEEDNQRRIAFAKKVRKPVRIITVVLAILAIVCLTLGFIGINQLPPARQKPVASNIFQEFGNWVHYDVFRNELPASEIPPLLAAASFNLWIGSISLCLFLLVMLILPVWNHYFLKSKKRHQLHLEWFKYQYLLAMFRYTETAAKEGIIE